MGRGSVNPILVHRAHGTQDPIGTRPATSLPPGSITAGAAAVVPALCAPPCTARAGAGGEWDGFHPSFSQPLSGTQGSFWVRSSKASTSLRPGSDTAAPCPGTAPPPAPWGRVGPLVQLLSGGSRLGRGGSCHPPPVAALGWGWGGFAGGIAAVFKHPQSICKRSGFGGDPGEPPGLQPQGAASGAIMVPGREPAAGLTPQLGTPSSGTVHTTG